MEFYIKENLKYLRKINELSQDELAQIVNYSFRTISKWETGESIPTYDNLNVLSRYFNIPIDDLMKKDLSKIKDYQKFSLKLIDNKNNFLRFQKELYKYLFIKSNNETLKDILYKNNLLIPNDFAFSEQINLLLKREKLNYEKARYILDRTLEEIRKNSLIDYYDIVEIKDEKFVIKYKVSV